MNDIHDTKQEQKERETDTKQKRAREEERKRERVRSRALLKNNEKLYVLSAERQTELEQLAWKYAKNFAFPLTMWTNLQRAHTRKDRANEPKTERDLEKRLSLIDRRESRKQQTVNCHAPSTMGRAMAMAMAGCQGKLERPSPCLMYRPHTAAYA